MTWVLIGGTGAIIAAMVIAAILIYGIRHGGEFDDNW